MAARIFVRITSGKQGSGRETDCKSEQQFLKPQKIYVVIERKMKLIANSYWAFTMSQLCSVYINNLFITALSDM